MVLLEYEAQVEAHFSLFRDMIIMTQHRCIVCDKRTKGSEIAVDTPDVLLGDVAQVEAHFGLFRDGANLDAR
jgi:hypothetical protein